MSIFDYAIETAEKYGADLAKRVDFSFDEGVVLLDVFKVLAVMDAARTLPLLSQKLCFRSGQSVVVLETAEKVSVENSDVIVFEGYSETHQNYILVFYEDDEELKLLVHAK